MNEQLENLGKRAVACKHWRWMPGMLARGKVPKIDTAFGRVSEEYAGAAVPYQLADPWPDLSDPATLGCLLHLVREAWGRDAYVEVHKYEKNGGRYLCDTQVGVMFPGQTEAEALVETLEAAP